jgi:CO dehydrogenase/acetyl-CoA synthase beta subunit
MKSTNDEKKDDIRPEDDEELCNCNLCYTFRYIALCISRCWRPSNKIE